MRKEIAYQRGFLITVWNSGISGGRRGLLGAGGGTQGLGGVGGSGEPLGTPREEGGRGMLNLCMCPWAGPDVHGYTGRSWGRICGHTTAQTFRGRRGHRHTSRWMSSRCGMRGCFPRGWVFTTGRDRKRPGPGSDSGGQPAGICPSLGLGRG